MREHVQYVEVTLKLPIETYRPIERKATNLGIRAHALLTELVVQSVAGSRSGAPLFKVSRERKAAARRPAPSAPATLRSLTDAPTGRRSYVRVKPEDVPVMREMAIRGDSADDIAVHFGISNGSAYTWRRKLRAAHAAEVEAAAAADSEQEEAA